MITNNNNWYSPLRSIEARVELYNGSTLVDTYTPSTALKEFTIERVGESGKFFGFGICQKLILKLIDKNRLINISKGNSFKVFLGAGAEMIGFPTFYVEEVKRDENTNELTITAYDILYKAMNRKSDELRLPHKEGSYSSYPMDYLIACSELLGVGVHYDELSDFTQINFPEGANFNGDESIRSVLDSMAEITQQIYYISYDNAITYKQLYNPLYRDIKETIDKSKYFTLKTGEAKTLGKIVHATELGDNVAPVVGDQEGEVQYIRDNPFWELRDDIADLVNAAQARICGFSLNQFTLEWRGNPALEIGDKIELVTKDNEIITSFILNDTITYNGALKQNTEWNYSSSGDTETAENPASLGEFLKKTSARVDKVNQRITLEVAETNDRLSQVELDTNGIKLSVEGIEEDLSAANKDLEEIKKKAELMITEENVEIKIKQELDNGVSKVVTEQKRYKFDDAGLTISADGDAISTKIDNNGMEISREDEVVLTADSAGVNARNLHAVTYLIIGSNSRLEDMANGRTGCFWIGG